MSDDFDLARFLPYRLAVLAERVSRRLAVSYGTSHGLSVAEWRVLAHLGDAGTASVRDIVDRVSMEKSRVSRAVSRLEAAGFVVKAPGRHDARLIEIALTEAGRTALTEIVPSVLSIEAALLDGISDADRAAFERVMDHLTDRAGRS